jgi:UDP-glucose 4-epimerase
MANYLVTGAAGFIGAAIAKKLLKDGHKVVTIDNLSTGVVENIPEGTVFIEGDCAEPDVYMKVPHDKYDAIFHIAGQSSGEISFDDPIYDIRTNAESTLLLLKFAQQNGCTRFIYASTMSVYGNKPDKPINEYESCNPQSFYGVGKLASEHYMRIYNQFGINSTSLRLFNVYGPGQNLSNLRQGMVSIFMAQLLDSYSIQVKGSGERYRDFIYIDDVVHAFISCLETKATWNKVINIGTGVRTTVSILVKLLVELSGQDISVQYKGFTDGDIHGIFADNGLMMELMFEQNPITELSVGLEKMWSHVQ